MIFLQATPAWPEEAELNFSLAGAIFEPWDGQTGRGVILSGQYALEKRRFWIGLEVEHREFDGSLESDFSPTYNSILFRGLFHFHPFPEAMVSPYVGVGTGLALHVTDRKGGEGDERKQFRRSVSAGTTFLGLVGVQTQIPGTQRFSLFAEARIETASDVWKKRGSNWRYDQAGGVTGTMGLRARF
jgi:hypothetical protein